MPEASENTSMPRVESVDELTDPPTANGPTTSPVVGAVAVSGVIVRVGSGGAGVDPPARAAWVAATIAAMASCWAG